MTTKRQWLRGRAGVLVAAVGLLLWAEIVGLSSVLYQGCASPLVANGFTVAFSLGMLAAVAALSLVAARAPKGVGRFAARAFPPGVPGVRHVGGSLAAVGGRPGKFG